MTTAHLTKEQRQIAKYGTCVDAGYNATMSGLWSSSVDRENMRLPVGWRWVLSNKHDTLTYECLADTDYYAWDESVPYVGSDTMSLYWRRVPDRDAQLKQHPKSECAVCIRKLPWWET